MSSSILRSRNFFSLFLTQFFGAFNDNLYKNALIIYITYDLSLKKGFDPGIFITASAGVFILPFFLFSASAGVIADTLEKSRLVQRIKFVEIIIMSVAIYGFYAENLLILMTVLFFMGVQSAMFGPLKYSLLPIFLKSDELVRGNGLINFATFTAILLGTIGGSYLILEENGVPLTGVGLIVFAFLGWGSSLFLQKTAHSGKVKWTDAFNFVRQIRLNYTLGTKNSKIKQTLYGVSWFWFIGASILSQLPIMVSVDLNADNTVYMLFLGLFAVGIGLGALLCNLFIPYPTIRHAPHAMAALGGLLFLCFGAFLILPDMGGEQEKITLLEFMAMGRVYPILATFFLMATAGGIYMIPQFALMQQLSKPEERSRIIACNNVLSALFMVASALVIIGFNVFNTPVPVIFALVGLMNIPFFFYWKKI